MIYVEHAFQMRLFYLIVFFTFRMATKEGKYHRYLQRVVQDVAKYFPLYFLEKLTEPLILIFTSTLPLHPVSCEAFCHFNLLIRFSVCTLPPFTVALSYFCSFHFFLFLLQRPDRSIDRWRPLSAELLVWIAFDGIAVKEKGGGAAVCSWYLREGEEMKVGSAINRCRNQNLEIWGPSPALSDVFQNWRR